MMDAFQKMEPESGGFSPSDTEGAAAISTAISLKRIADAMELSNALMLVTTGALAGEGANVLVQRLAECALKPFIEEGELGIGPVHRRGQEPGAAPCA